MDIKPFLKTLPAFEGFSDGHLDGLSSLLKMRDCPAGHRLIVQGQQGDAMYLLMAGSVGISRVHEVTGETEEERDLHAGETCGLLSLVENMPAVWSATARDATVAATLSRPDFLALYGLAPPIAHHLQYMVAVQLARDLQARNRELRELLARRTRA